MFFHNSITSIIAPQKNIPFLGKAIRELHAHFVRKICVLSLNIMHSACNIVKNDKFRRAVLDYFDEVISMKCIRLPEINACAFAKIICTMKM